jgi:hypothetical protein
MSLFCAIQKDISKGMYYYNAVGLAEFPKETPATFDDKSKYYYDRLDSLRVSRIISSSLLLPCHTN